MVMNKLAYSHASAAPRGTDLGTAAPRRHSADSAFARFAPLRELSFAKRNLCPNPLFASFAPLRELSLAQRNLCPNPLFAPLREKSLSPSRQVRQGLAQSMRSQIGTSSLPGGECA